MNPDGNTGIQVAPTQESEEMSKVRQVFDNAINAMVDATRLSKEVAEIRAEVSEIKFDLDKARQRNAELDTMLNDTREQRNRWRDKAEGLEHELETTHVNYGREIETLKAQNEGLTSAKASAEQVINNLNNQVNDLSKKNDDLELQVMQLQDDLHKANDKLDTLKGYAQSIFGLHEPKPEPVPEPAPQAPNPVQSAGDANQPYDPAHDPNLGYNPRTY